jgi:CheY-like chemotaxis protein
MSRERTILLATSRPEDLQAFASAIEGREKHALILADTAEAALEAAKRRKPDLVVLDRQVNGADAMTIARLLLEVNAFIHTALLSDLPEADFHEASEGLGVLMKLPMTPSAGDAELLLARLDEIAPA